MITALSQSVPLGRNLAGGTRSWVGFSVTLLGFGSAADDEPAFPDHTLRMHLGAPAHARNAGDGGPHHRTTRAGDIDIIPSGFSLPRTSANPTPVLSVRIHPHFLRSTAETLDIDPASVRIEPQYAVRDAHLQHIMWTLKAEMEDYAPADDLYGESLGIALATRLLRRFSRRLRVAEPNASKRRLLDVLAYIDEHLDTPLAISSLAEYADLSVSHFKSLFRTVAGLPVHQYVLQRRIDVALALIAKRVPLKDVAARAGFYDQSHMTRTIRRRLGTSPHELSMQ